MAQKEEELKVVFLIKSFDWYETIGIVIAIFLASFISTVSEYGSERAFKRLQEEASKIKCRVKRDNKVTEISVDDVVVGDIVLLSSGDKVPADGVLVDGKISVDESILNGESKEKYKNINDSIYRGSIVASGVGVMCIKKVGSDTFYGKLASEIEEKQPESISHFDLLSFGLFKDHSGFSVGKSEWILEVQIGGNCRNPGQKQQ